MAPLDTKTSPRLFDSVRLRRPVDEMPAGSTGVVVRDEEGGCFLVEVFERPGKPLGVVAAAVRDLEVTKRAKT